MDLGNYGIGGNEVKIDASEGIAEIPQNRTLLVEQLTKDEPVAPEVITGADQYRPGLRAFLTGDRY